MHFSEVFIRRPIGTALLTIGVALAGIGAYFFLPVAPMPQADLPVVFVQATLPGASPETMATSVATPLERRLGHIADVDEMTSQSRVNSSTIVLQFGIDRDVNGAARDVQAAINASRADLPVTLRSNPIYRIANPASAPILILALTSSTRTPGQIYDSASNIIQQKLSQVKGVGEVNIGGASLPAVRIELNPYQMAHYGIGLEDVRAALSSANANRPKGVVADGQNRLQIYTNDSGTKAVDYQPLVIAYRDGAAVRLSDIGDVVDGVEDIHNLGLFNGQPSVVVQVTAQAGANIINTVNDINAIMPQVEAALPADIQVHTAVDRTTSIRASLADVERNLLIAVILVVAVVAVFLRSPGATLVPAVAVTVSLLGTLAVMLLLGFSLDNLSLMALTVSTGFVVDDAIVVLENITRHLEQGMSRFEAAITGVKEVGFTVFSISISLIAVFLPILLMGGIVGKLFREFALTLSTAILVSLAISLTTTPMMCAYLLTWPKEGDDRSRIAKFTDGVFDGMTRVYRASLLWALDSGPVILVILVLTIVLNVYLYGVVPKGFMPQESNAQLNGFMQTDQSTSFQLTKARLTRYVDIIRADPDVLSVAGFTGGRSAGGQVFVTLKPKTQRDGQVSDDVVMGRLRQKMLGVTGASLFLQSVQDLQIGGRQSFAQYQYTLKADDLASLHTWATKLGDELKKQPLLTDVNSDQEDHGLESYVTIDRATAGRFGITDVDVDNTLYDAFGQRQASVIYNALNQYHVVMEVAQPFQQEPDALNQVYVSTSTAGRAPVSATTSSAGGGASTGTSGGSSTTALGGATSTSLTSIASQNSLAGKVGQTTIAGPVAPPTRGASAAVAVSSVKETMVPLSTIATFGPAAAPISVNHQDESVATTISFNLAPGHSLSDATDAINTAEATIGMPTSVRGSFQGTAKVFQQSLGNEPILILAALLAIYIVLGVLYESYVHPLTVLSTLPSAGVGATLALIVFQSEFDIIALIGVILLIGIVKKNAIMIIDFALEAERTEGLSSRDAIFQACMLRFRPIMMTTFAAILGAVPLAIGWGQGAELRRPLGITIIGGLVVSQLLTLLTTPVVYLYMDRWRKRPADERRLSRFPDDASTVPDPAS
jgi:multidrug efflux pump